MNLPPEQECIRARCFHPSGMPVEFPVEDIETSIPARFEKIVRKYPDRIAFKDIGRSASYDELNQVSNKIAGALLEKCGNGSEPIALLFEHGIDVILAILGVLKAGKFFIALDASLPESRLSHLLDDCTAKLIVTNELNQTLARGLTHNRLPLLNIDSLESNATVDHPNVAVLPRDIAYVLYTSGSTGHPKGVIQNHRNILHLIQSYSERVHLCAADRLTFINSCSSAAGMRNIFGALLNGAGLFAFDPRRQPLIDFGGWVTREEVTICHAMISVFRSIVEVLSGHKTLSSVRLVELAGGSLSVRDLNTFKNYFLPRCVFAHSMGASELGTACWNFVDDLSQSNWVQVPIGYGVRDMEILVLDDYAKKVNGDEVGEIAVRSSYLSPGYWRDPDLTKAKFIASLNPAEPIYLTGDLGRMAPDGCLEYVGRKDFRTKIQGVTVDPTEVEITLLQQPQVSNAAVVTRKRESGEYYLLACIVPRENSKLTIENLRSFLRERLPDPMIPSTFMFLDSLPLANGKIDTTALPFPDGERPNLAVPYRPPLEKIQINIAKIWETVLEIYPVGIDDNFFDLGGDSLAASRVISKVIQTFQLKLPVTALFYAPTVAQMAAIVEQHQTKRGSEAEVEQMLHKIEAMAEDEVQWRVVEINLTVPKK